MQSLFTTGYAGFDHDGFVWKLRLDGIEAVVDVREKPVSRNRAFSQDILRPFLEMNGFEYFHFGELGVPSHLRRNLHSSGDLGDYFEAYRVHLKGAEDAITQLSELVGQKRCCLLCLERNPLDCHRSVLADVLVEKLDDHIEVKHI